MKEKNNQQIEYNVLWQSDDDIINSNSINDDRNDNNKLELTPSSFFIDCNKMILKISMFLRLEKKIISIKYPWILFNKDLLGIAISYPL
jgi:hypothetical protein